MESIYGCLERIENKINGLSMPQSAGGDAEADKEVIQELNALKTGFKRVLEALVMIKGDTADFDGVVGCQGAAATFHGLHIVYVDFVVIGIYRFPDVTFGLCFLFTPALCCCGLHGKHSRQT